MALVKAKLTIRDEPFIVPDDEVDSLRAQGLLEGEPEPVEDPAPPPARPELPKPTVPPLAAPDLKKD